MTALWAKASQRLAPIAFVAGLCVFLLACAPTKPEPPHPTLPNPALSSSALSKPALPSPSAEASGAALLNAAASLPGPGPRIREAGYDVARENGECERCHPTIAAEWRSSLHAQSYDNELFMSAYALEPRPFCRRCHAPEIDEQRRTPDPNRHLGIACVSCHVMQRGIVGVRSAAGSERGHPVLGDPRAGTEAWCGGCHQFEFPVPQQAPLQGTLQEHERSPHQKRVCQDCHMLEIGEGQERHRDHRFRVFGNTEMLRSAIEVTAKRSSASELSLTLRVTGAGHAVPTGDLFRQLQLRAWSDSHYAQPVVLRREYRQEVSPQSGMRRVQTRDGRLRADGEPSRVTLRFDNPVKGTVHWEVVYQRMGPEVAALFGVDLRSEEIRLAEGSVPFSPNTPRATIP